VRKKERIFTKQAHYCDTGLGWHAIDLMVLLLCSSQFLEDWWKAEKEWCCGRPFNDARNSSCSIRVL